MAAQTTAGSTTVPARRRALFHPLMIAAVRRLTENSIEVTFQIPDRLSDDFTYQPGQYVALRTTIDDEDLRRSYSICSAQVEGELRIAIKKDLGGVFSSWALESLQPGMHLDVMIPQGTFTTRIDLNAAMDDAKHYAAIAAGSGITPIMSLARTALSQSLRSQFTLIYANRSALDVMFLEELADLKDRYPTRFSLNHVLSREVRSAAVLSGRLDEEKLHIMLEELIRSDPVDEWFLCGPFELVQLCRDLLAAAGVPASAVNFELFTTGTPGTVEGSRGRRIRQDPSVASNRITFTLDGRTATVSTPINARETILNAALRVRPDVPFACAGGVCGTCRAKLLNGEVSMDDNYALEPDELERGYVLTCQSHATAKAVSVSSNA